MTLADILYAEARAAGLPEAWAVSLTLTSATLAAGRAAVADAKEWFSIAQLVNRGEMRERYDLLAIASAYRRAGLPLAQFRADIIAKRAEIDAETAVWTTPPTHPRDRLGSAGVNAAMAEVARQFWAARKAEQEGNHADA